MTPGKNVIKIEVVDEDEESAKPARKKTAPKTTKTKTLRKEKKTAKPKKKTEKKTAKKPAALKKGKKIKKTELDSVSITEIEEPAELEGKKVAKLLTNLSLKKKGEGEHEKQEVAAPEKVVKNEEDQNFDKILEGKSSKINEVIKESVVNEQVDMEEKIEKAKAYTPSGRSIKLYRRIAYFFIALTLVLVFVVSYYSIVKVDITLIPNQERVSNNLIFDVYDQDKTDGSSGNSIVGIVREIDVEENKEYVPSGEDVIGKEVIGDVVIYNNYSKNQPLVASTRLLSSDGKLYRLKSTVNVPAGAKLEVGIYADEAEEDMVVAPTKFTIPGLWAGLQDKIFAESKEATVFQKKINRFVTKDDSETAERDLKQQLLVKAKEEVNEKYKEYSQILYKIDENSINSSIDAEVGEEIDLFEASMSAKVIVVAFDNNKSVDLAKQKFVSILAKTKELISFEDDKIIYSLNNFDINNGSAAVNAQFSGKVSLKNDSEIIELDKIVGLNKDQLDAYLAGVEDIAGFEVKFRPSFIKRVPRLVDRINIEVKR